MDDGARFRANPECFSAGMATALKEGIRRGGHPGCAARESFTAVRYQDVRIVRLVMDKLGAQ